MARNTPSEEDIGKKVVNAHGETIGMVSGFNDGQAFVDPDPGVTDKIMSRLGWADIDEGDYAVDASQVDRIDDDEIRLKSDL
jgi:hypothetical protein